MRFNIEETENYSGSGGGGFFSLKDDKDTASIRFMYNDLSDMEDNYSVHEVEIDGKVRYVNCIRAYNEPLDNCPLCATRSKLHTKLFLQVYDEETEEVKIWSRGKTFFNKLSSLCARYTPLVSTPFEIERNGKKGDMKTTYETYALATDEVTLDDLPEKQELFGTLVLDKTFDEIEFFLETGYFEPDENDEPVTTKRQSARTVTAKTGSSRTSKAEPEKTTSRTTRRTPANTAPEPETKTTTPAGRGSRRKGNTDKF